MEGTPLIVDGDNEPVDTRITNHRTPISPLAHGSVGRHDQALPPGPPRHHGSVGHHDQPFPPGPPPHGHVGVYDPVPLAIPADLPRNPPALSAAQWLEDPWQAGTTPMTLLESRIAALESRLAPTGVVSSVPGQGSVIDRLAALENAMTACHAALPPAISDLERQVRDLQRRVRENRWQMRAFAMWLMRHRASDAWYYYDDVDALLGLMWDENDNWDSD